jgi:hypothetical protein
MRKMPRGQLEVFFVFVGVLVELEVCIKYAHTIGTYTCAKKNNTSTGSFYSSFKFLLCWIP